MHRWPGIGVVGAPHTFVGRMVTGTAEINTQAQRNNMSEAQFPIELSPPDVTPYRSGNTGVDYVTTFRSGKSGPHVLVSAVVHGNELCGAIALDFLHQLEVRPRVGTLTLAFMNVDAYLRFNAASPTASRCVDEDFNRLWSDDVLNAERTSVELRRAREVRPVVDQADMLLDIHSMQASATPLMLAGAHDKGVALARAIGAPMSIVCDEGHAAGRRMRDYAGFGDSASRKGALLVECGQHWLSQTATLAKEVALRFLCHFGLIERDFMHAHIDLSSMIGEPVIDVTEPVTIATDTFRFVKEFASLDVIEKSGTLIGWDGDTPVRTPYDKCVLIMPSRDPRKGQSAVRLGRYREVD